MKLTNKQMNQAYQRFIDENKDGKLNESVLVYTSKLIDFKDRISKLSKKQFNEHLEIFKIEYQKRKNQ